MQTSPESQPPQGSSDGFGHCWRQLPFTHAVAAQLPSEHIWHAPILGQSSTVLQPPSQTGRFSWHLRLASQYMTTAGTEGQSAPVQAAQVSPHCLPLHGSSLVHESMPALQTPLSQRDHGQALEPSGQSSHGARLLGQSASAWHSAGQLGYELTHEPLTQSVNAHANVPSAHCMHWSSCPQSFEVLHSAPPQFGAPLWHWPFASHTFTSAVSAQLGSFGAQSVQEAPHAFPAHGS
jgi:hypothetical protein